MTELFLSDDFIFYTIEGEGRLIGYPSVFMRLSMCNLTCQGFKSKASPYGCDSFASWSIKNRRSFDEIFQLMEAGSPNFVDHLRHGAIWKITGGEPFIQQKALIEFVKEFAKRYEFLPAIDFETNGTIQPDNFWVDIASFTCSPKLSNNGDPEDKRFKPEVLKWLSDANACFKFVIQNEEDVAEIIQKYIESGLIGRNQIWLMPCCGSRNEQNERSQAIAELCKAAGFKFSPRLQLMIWDKALKV